MKSVSSGSGIYVAGFPLPTSAVPTRIFRFLKGDVIANATVAIPNGYQLLYSNPTLPGMSGGAVMNAQGASSAMSAAASLSRLSLLKIFSPSSLVSTIPLTYLKFVIYSNISFFGFTTPSSGAGAFRFLLRSQ